MNPLLRENELPHVSQVVVYAKAVSEHTGVPLHEVLFTAQKAIYRMDCRSREVQCLADYLTGAWWGAYYAYLK